MAKKKQKGGRKKIAPDQKVVLVGFYTKKEVIDSVGGMDITRSLAKEYIESVSKI